MLGGRAKHVCSTRCIDCRIGYASRYSCRREFLPILRNSYNFHSPIGTLARGCGPVCIGKHSCSILSSVCHYSWTNYRRKRYHPRRSIRGKDFSSVLVLAEREENDPLTIHSHDSTGMQFLRWHSVDHRERDSLDDASDDKVHPRTTPHRFSSKHR